MFNMLMIIFNYISSIKWDWLNVMFGSGKYYSLTDEDQNKIRELLKPDYYIILIKRKFYLTTFLINLASLVLTSKWSHYSHALMNVDGGNIRNDQDFKLIEATGVGVHYSSFGEVFDCDSVALLKPKNFTAEKWTYTLDKLLASLGKPYDSLFDILDDTKVSCIELVRSALENEPNYAEDFKNFEAMIKKNGNELTPQMLYDCPDFEIVFEVRR